MKRWKMVGFFITLSIFCAFLNDQALAGLSEEQIKAFRSIKSVRIVVDQAYGEAEGVSLPFKDVVQRVLGYAGVKVVGADSKEYDATLKIEARGKAKGIEYSRFGIGPGTFYYTGADLSGVISLKSPGIPVHKKTFNGDVYPPYSIKFGGSSSPSGAPFYRAFSIVDSFISAILEIIGEVYGLNPLLIALKDIDTDVRANVAWVLRETKDTRAIKPLIEALEGFKGMDSKFLLEIVSDLSKIGKPAVEPLIEVLKDKDSYVRGNAAWVLRAITGQDFGEDPIKWQEWWEEDKKETRTGR